MVNDFGSFPKRVCYAVFCSCVVCQLFRNTIDTSCNLFTNNCSMNITSKLFALLPYPETYTGWSSYIFQIWTSYPNQISLPKKTWSIITLNTTTPIMSKFYLEFFPSILNIYFFLVFCKTWKLKLFNRHKIFNWIQSKLDL